MVKQVKKVKPKKKFGVLLWVSPDKLKIREDNAKVHTEEQIAGIVRIIQETAFLDPIEVDRNDIIIAGHGRLEAAYRLGMDKVPVIFHDMEYHEADLYALVHNNTTLSTGIDLEAAANQITELGGGIEDALTAGISSDEFELSTQSASRSHIDYGSSGEQITGSTSTHKGMLFRFANQQEEDDWRAMMLELKNKFPGEGNDADRLLRLVAWDRTHS